MTDKLNTIISPGKMYDKYSYIYFIIKISERAGYIKYYMVPVY